MKTVKTILKACLRIILIPIDFLSLTFDTIRATLWLVVRLLRAVAGGSYQMKGKCFGAQTASSAQGNHKRYSSVSLESDCGCIRKYANPAILRLLCSGVKREIQPDGNVKYHCGRQGVFVFSAPRYALTLLILFTLILAAVLATKHYRNTLRGIAQPRAASHTQSNQQKQQGRTKHSKHDKEIALEHLERGLRQAERHQDAAARVEFRNAIQRDPTLVPAYLGLAQAAKRLRNLDEARRAYEALSKLPSASSEHRHAVGLLEFELQNYDGAITACQEILKLQPDYLPALTLMADSYKMKGDLDQAQIVVTRILAAKPNAPDGFIAQATLALARKDTAAARTAFTQAMNNCPTSLVARVGLATVDAMAGNTTNAISALLNLHESMPDEVYVSSELADLYIRLGHIQKAITLYKKVTSANPELQDLRCRLAELQINTGDINAGYLTLKDLIRDAPDNTIALLILSDLFLKKGLASMALDYCSKALNLSPRIEKAHLLMARAHMANGSFDKAVEILDPFTRAIPRNIDAKLLLSTCYDRLNKSDLAAQLIKDAMEQNTNSPLPYLYSAGRYVADNKPAQAIETYRKAILLAPKNVSALNNLATLLLDTRGKDPAAAQEAFDCASRAWQESPGDPSVADTLGWAHYHKQQYEEALQYLALSVKREPRNPIGRFHLGLTLHAKGSFPEARVQLEYALKMAPNFRGSDTARTTLEAIQRKIGKPAEKKD